MALLTPEIRLLNPVSHQHRTGDERDVLTLIAVRLFCAAGEKHSFETVAAVLECAGHNFTAKGLE